MKEDVYSDEDLPEEVEDLIQRFPNELRHRWREKVRKLRTQDKEKSTDEQKQILLKALSDRKEVKVPRFRSPRILVLKEPPAEIILALRYLETGTEEVNRGSWGKILRCKSRWRMPDSELYREEEVLFKVPHGNIPEDLKALPHNDLQAEAGFLAEAHALSTANSKLRVGVPCPYFLVDYRGHKVIAQEDIAHAVSVKDIVNGKIIVPDSYPITEAFNAMQTFTDILHKAGIYHRDLREGNIMINLRATIENSEPLIYMIDFGQSIQAYSEEGSRRDGLDYGGDSAMISLVEKTLQNHNDNGLGEKEFDL